MRTVAVKATHIEDPSFVDSSPIAELNQILAIKITYQFIFIFSS